MDHQRRRWSLSELPPKIILDSVLLIGHLHTRNFHHPSAKPIVTHLLRRVAEGSCQLFYNAVIEAEIWPALTDTDGRRRSALLLSVMQRLELDSAGARRGGDLARAIRRNIALLPHRKQRRALGKHIRSTGEWQPDWKLGDALIAATAETHRVAILTNNHDFDYLRPELRDVTIIQSPTIDINR